MASEARLILIRLLPVVFVAAAATAYVADVEGADAYVVRNAAPLVLLIGLSALTLYRGKRKKQDQDSLIPSILEPEGSSEEFRKSWARLIQKIYEVDPLTCPKCSGVMKVISVIEDEEVIKKILKHLGLWGIKTRPPPKATGAQRLQNTAFLFPRGFEHPVVNGQSVGFQHYKL